jgi:hypothetical protein
VFEKGCGVIIVGASHEGNVRLSPDASDYFEKKRCGVILRPTREAIRSFNHSKANKIGLMHVTCRCDAQMEGCHSARGTHYSSRGDTTCISFCEESFRRAGTHD